MLFKNFANHFNERQYSQSSFRWKVDAASVYPREVVKLALKHNASAMILTPNHPSGKPDLSHANISITQRLKDALAFVDVRVLDHIVVGTEGSYSLAEHGKL